MTTALVSGAAGFIGSHLVDELLTRGYQVRGLDNLVTGDRSNLGEAIRSDSFTFVEGDIRDRKSVREVMKDSDIVFHLAAQTSVPGSVEEPGRATDVNCTGTARILEAAIDYDVDHLVFSSSAAVYGSDVDIPIAETDTLTPESPYALSKYYGEELLDQYTKRTTLNATSLRFFNVFGPRQDPEGDYAAVIPAFIDKMIDGSSPIIFGDGEQTRDFIFVTDVVKAMISTAESDCSESVMNIGRGTKTSIKDVAFESNDIFGTDIPIKYEAARQGDVRHSVASISRARSELGFEPDVSLREGLELTVDAFRSKN